MDNVTRKINLIKRVLSEARAAGTLHYNDSDVENQLNNAKSNLRQVPPQERIRRGSDLVVQVHPEKSITDEMLAPAPEQVNGHSVEPTCYQSFSSTTARIRPDLDHSGMNVAADKFDSIQQAYSSIYSASGPSSQKKVEKQEEQRSARQHAIGIRRLSDGMSIPLATSFRRWEITNDFNEEFVSEVRKELRLPDNINVKKRKEIEGSSRTRSTSVGTMSGGASNPFAKAAAANYEKRNQHITEDMIAAFDNYLAGDGYVSPLSGDAHQNFQGERYALSEKRYLPERGQQD